jgi:hypothetical protein
MVGLNYIEDLLYQMKEFMMIYSVSVGSANSVVTSFVEITETIDGLETPRISSPFNSMITKNPCFSVSSSSSSIFSSPTFGLEFSFQKLDLIHQSMQDLLMTINRCLDYNFRNLK